MKLNSKGHLFDILRLALIAVCPDFARCPYAACVIDLISLRCYKSEFYWDWFSWRRQGLLQGPANDSNAAKPQTTYS